MHGTSTARLAAASSRYIKTPMLYEMAAGHQVSADD